MNIPFSLILISQIGGKRLDKWFIIKKAMTTKTANRKFSCQMEKANRIIATIKLTQNHETSFGRYSYSGICQEISPDFSFKWLARSFSIRIGFLFLKSITDIRRGWDSNPRFGFPNNFLAGSCFRPLSHLSNIVILEKDI